jgi:hypothetical protein
MHEKGSLGGFDELGLTGLENARCARILGFAVEMDLVRGCSPNRQRILFPEQDLHFSEHFDFFCFQQRKLGCFADHRLAWSRKKKAERKVLAEISWHRLSISLTGDFSHIILMVENMYTTFSILIPGSQNKTRHRPSNKNKHKICIQQ